jgi:putative ABC transport system permease protein
MTDSLRQNARFALRQLRLNPGFSLVAIACLALGSGANTAIFQLIDSIRLRTLPVQSPQQLVELHIDDMTHARGGTLRDNSVTNPLWEQIRARGQDLFAGTFAWADEGLNVAPAGELNEVAALWVSGDFFRVLGVQPILGRVFTAADDRRGCGLAPGAVISYGYWRSELAGDPQAIGRSIVIAEHRVAVVGVTPPGFFGLEVGRTFDVALPICSQPALGQGRLDSGTTWWLTVMGRMQPGMKPERLAPVLRGLSGGIFEATLPAGYPSDSVKPYLAMKLLMAPAGAGISRLRDQYSTPLNLLLAIAGLVLLIACANLANLMLARASARRREMAVRLALGASRARLIQQLMLEGLLLAVAGVALGLLLAQALSRMLVSFVLNPDDPTFLDLRPDARVFAFTALVAVLTCILFSLAPALQAARTDPGNALKSGGRAIASPRDRFRLRRLLVASQVALSLVLLVGALLFVRSLGNLLAIDPGFDPRGIVIADVNFSGLHLAAGRTGAFHQELIQRVRAIPGVQSAAEASVVPLSGASWNNRMWMDGSDFEHARVALRSMVGSGYFRTLRTPLVAGREFDDRDSQSQRKVAIVNQAFARQLAAGRNPVGLRFWIETTPFEPQTVYEIVGLVKDTKYRNLREDFEPVVYTPLWPRTLQSSDARIMIRSGLGPGTLVSAARAGLAAISPSLGYSFHVFDSWIQDSLLPERLMARLSLLFGALAAALTACGLYGVISYTVARRTGEIGVRMALGASRGNVAVLILSETAAVVALGLAAGAILSLGAGRSAAALLFGVKSYDPLILIAAGMAIAMVAALASYLPALRASNLNPAIALREE